MATTFGLADTKIPKYSYPHELDLRPDKTKHRELVAKLREMARSSNDKMSKRHQVWNDIEKQMKAYIKLDKSERDLKAEDSRKPVSVVVPLSSVAADTLLTSFSSALLQLPYYRFQGAGPEDQIGAILLEKIIEHQSLKFKQGLALHTMFRDAIVYGLGAVSLDWRTKKGRVRRNQPILDMGYLGSMEAIGLETVRNVDTLYEGNSLQNIDPFCFLPDPNVPIQRFQEGEFVAWVERTNYLSLVRLEDEGGGQFFNVKHIGGRKNSMRSRFSRFEFSGSGRDNFKDDLPDQYTDASHDQSRSSLTRPVDVVHFYVTLIPAEWEIGDSQSPEKWVFEVAGDDLLIRMNRIDLDHDMYPVAVCAPEYDGYSITPTSKIELSYGLQEFANFLFNSHMTNVRKAINDVIIYDPFLLDSEAMENPGPGKLVQTRMPAWGKGVAGAVEQLKITDVTQNNIRDIGFISGMFERITSAVDNLQGVANTSGERVSANESRGARGAAASRMEKAVMIANLQAMHDLGFMQAYHTQQFMDKDVYVNVLGEWEEVLKNSMGGAVSNNRLSVTPDMINIAFDVKPVDNTIKGGEFAEVWVQLFQSMAASPELQQSFDIPKVFMHVARIMGANNVHEFVKRGGAIRPEVMGPEQIAQQEQAGDIVPLENMV